MNSDNTLLHKYFEFFEKSPDIQSSFGYHQKDVGLMDENHQDCMETKWVPQCYRGEITYKLRLLQVVLERWYNYYRSPIVPFCCQTFS